MELSLDIPPGAATLLGLMDSWATMLAPIRGFEFPAMTILLRLALAPGHVLDCTYEQLGHLCGLSPSTAIRLARILAEEQQIALTDLGENNFCIALTKKGEVQSFRLTNAVEAKRSED